MEDIFLFFKFLEEFHKVKEKILYPDPDTTCLRSSSVNPLTISDTHPGVSQHEFLPITHSPRATHCLKNKRNGWGKDPLFLDSNLSVVWGDVDPTILSLFPDLSYTEDHLPLGK